LSTLDFKDSYKMNRY